MPQHAQRQAAVSLFGAGTCFQRCFRDNGHSRIPCRGMSLSVGRFGAASRAGRHLPIFVIPVLIIFLLRLAAYHARYERGWLFRQRILSSRPENREVGQAGHVPGRGTDTVDQPKQSPPPSPRPPQRLQRGSRGSSNCGLSYSLPVPS